MKAADLRNQSIEELEQALLKLREEQFKQQMQRSTGQLGQLHLLKENRREVARIKTVLNEKKRHTD
jgi:large subunit ribosomal protein L29